MSYLLSTIQRLSKLKLYVDEQTSVQYNSVMAYYYIALDYLQGKIAHYNFKLEGLYRSGCLMQNKKRESQELEEKETILEEKLDHRLR